MSDKNNNLQDIFLNALRKSKTPVTMFLVKGVKLQGIVTWFDNFSVLLRRDGQAQLVYKHAISTIMPSQWDGVEALGITSAKRGGANRSLQEIFLGAVEKEKEPVTMFLVNGVMLQGRVSAFDLFCILLERDDQYQLVYKHAVSTVQPLTAVDLSQADGEGGEEDGETAAED